MGYLACYLPSVCLLSCFDCGVLVVEHVKSMDLPFKPSACWLVKHQLGCLRMSIQWIIIKVCLWVHQLMGWLCWRGCLCMSTPWICLWVHQLVGWLYAGAVACACQLHGFASGPISLWVGYMPA
jgi:hypothetical protein